VLEEYLLIWNPASFTIIREYGHTETFVDIQRPQDLTEGPPTKKNNSQIEKEMESRNNSKHRSEEGISKFS
jgi:hypothetical protein